MVLYWRFFLPISKLNTTTLVSSVTIQYFIMWRNIMSIPLCQYWRSLYWPFSKREIEKKGYKMINFICNDLLGVITVNIIIGFVLFLSLSLSSFNSWSISKTLSIDRSAPYMIAFDASCVNQLFRCNLSVSRKLGKEIVVFLKLLSPVLIPKHSFLIIRINSWTSR